MSNSEQSDFTTGRWYMLRVSLIIALGGFLIGPPVIGTVAELTTLPVGLAMLLPGLILAIWLTKWLRPRDSL